MAKNKSVFGIYSSRSGVENAVVALKDSGFQHSDVSVLLPENLGNREISTEKNTKAPEGAATGAGSGAVIGGTLGWLVGIGALAIPGLGLFVAAGPIMAMLSGIGVGGVLGGIAGALAGLGTPEYEAKRYEGRIRKGGILLSVHCDDREWLLSSWRSASRFRPMRQAAIERSFWPRARRPRSARKSTSRSAEPIRAGCGSPIRTPALPGSQGPPM